MPDLATQRRIAALLLKCGEGRVWIDPSRNDDVADAVTRADLRSMIKSGAIRRKPKVGTSRARARRRAEELKRGRHAGPGSRRGTPSARVSSKERWMRRIRAQRQLLAQLRGDRKIAPKVYRQYYRQAKGGMFRSRAHLLQNLEIAGVLPQGARP